MTNTIIFVITVAIVFFSLSTFITVFVIVYQRRQMNFKKTTEQLKVNFQQTLLQTQLEIQEQTLKNISQEIHDNIGQVLSLVKLNINTMNCGEPKATQGKINDSKHLIIKAIQDLRDLSKSLNTDYVTDMGLVKSVEYELELIKKTGVYEIQCDIKGEPYRLEEQQELIFFRIVQEILHNIIRHAKATSIVVQLIFETEIFTLKVTDNGVGFETTQLEASNYKGLGLGIRNMHTRANMINTNFELTSALKNGTTVILTLPLQTPKL